MSTSRRVVVAANGSSRAATGASTLNERFTEIRKTVINEAATRTRAVAGERRQEDRFASQMSRRTQEAVAPSRTASRAVRGGAGAVSSARSAAPRARAAAAAAAAAGGRGSRGVARGGRGGAAPVRGGTTARGGARGRGGRGGRGARGGGRGRGGRGGRGGKPVSKNELDDELDKYMMGNAEYAKSRLDSELDSYMTEAQPEKAANGAAESTEKK